MKEARKEGRIHSNTYMCIYVYIQNITVYIRT